MTSSSNSFEVAVLLLWRLVTGRSYMLISWLVLGLWQFLFIKDWLEIRKSEIPPSEFCPIYGDWGKLEIANLARMWLIKSYWMLRNTRVIAFTFSELLKENQQGVKLRTSPPSPPPLSYTHSQIKVKGICKLEMLEQWVYIKSIHWEHLRCFVQFGSICTI